ncbi:MAG: peptide-methionine (S)-S-oxide reductase MsrA [Methanoregula sp.]|jgi:peptide-methionine (S)-S-oxide reductase
MDEGTEPGRATFAAGCFWGIEAAFRPIKGVIETAVGIIFDPAVVSYEKLLDTFWSIHDPTQVNRQGPDIGTSYRSAIFYHSPEQKNQDEASKARLAASEKYRGKTIATGIVPARQFWKAEDSHQQYYEKCGRGYCTRPKCWE